MDIKQLIKEYIKVDDQLTEMNKEVKEIRKSKNILEEQIKEFMVENNTGKVELGSNGTLRISKQKPAKKINKKLIMEVLLNSIDDHDKASGIISELFDDTEDTEEITKLERTKKKNKQN